MKKYELTIKVFSDNGDGKMRKLKVPNPFEDKKKKSKEEEKVDTFVKSAVKSVAINSSLTMVKSYTQTLGNSHFQETYELVENGINTALGMAILSKTLGGGGLTIGVLMMLPQLISKIISYSNGQTWDGLSQNKGLRRAGAEFNRSRI